MKLPICIWQYIMTFLRPIDNIRLIQVCKVFNSKLKIYRLSKHRKVNNNIINKYKNLKYLKLFKFRII